MERLIFLCILMCVVAIKCGYYLLHIVQGLEGLLEGMNSPPTDPELFVRFRDVHLLVLRLLQEPRALGPQAACR